MFNEQHLKKITAHLIKRQETIAVAESVTAGLLQAALASAENATAFFQGGITVYNITQKFRQLQVDPTNAIRCNCVSEEVAGQMAKGVLHSFGSHWAIGITGYASPLPGHPIDPLYACYAVAHKSGLLWQQTIYKNAGKPLDIQLFYVDEVLKSLPSLEVQ